MLFYGRFMLWGDGEMDSSKLVIICGISRGLYQLFFKGGSGALGIAVKLYEPFWDAR